MSKTSAIIHSITEKFVESLLKKYGAKKNNWNDRNAPDLIVKNKKIDVQYSQDFAKYGDIAFSIITSAVKDNNSYIIYDYEFLNKIQIERDIIINTPSSYYENEADYIFYLTFDDKIKIGNNNDLLTYPSYLVLFNIKEVLNLFERGRDTFYKNVILRTYRREEDNQVEISGFLPIKLDTLISYNLNHFSVYKHTADGSYVHVNGLNYDSIFA